MLKDIDIMTFGKHKGKAMIEVPKNWLLWFYDEINKTSNQEIGTNQLRVYNYIDHNYEAIEKEKESFQNEEKRNGFIVRTKTGKKGIIFHDEARENGKNKTYIVDDKMKQTGLKMLCDPMGMEIIGFIN